MDGKFWNQHLNAISKFDCFFGLPRAAWTFATKSTGDSIVFFCGVFVNNSVYVWFTLWAAFVTITRCIGISLNPTQDIPVKLCFDKLQAQASDTTAITKWMMPWLKEARLFTADPGKAEQTAKQWEDKYKLAAKKFCQGNQHISYFFFSTYVIHANDAVKVHLSWQMEMYIWWKSKTFMQPLEDSCTVLSASVTFCREGSGEDNLGMKLRPWESF